MRLLEEMEEVSAPGSVLLTSMTPISTVKKEHAASSLLASWVWGFGDDFTEARSHPPDMYTLGAFTVPGLSLTELCHAGVC